MDKNQSLTQQIDLLQLQLEECKYREANLKQANENLLAKLVDQQQNQQNPNILESQIHLEIQKTNTQLQLEITEIKQRHNEKIEKLEQNLTGLKDQVKQLQQEKYYQKVAYERIIKNQKDQITDLQTETKNLSIKNQNLDKQLENEIKKNQKLVKQNSQALKKNVKNDKKSDQDIQQIQKQQLEDLNEIKALYEKEKRALTYRLQQVTQQLLDSKKKLSQNPNQALVSELTRENEQLTQSNIELATKIIDLNASLKSIQTQH